MLIFILPKIIKYSFFITNLNYFIFPNYFYLLKIFLIIIFIINKNKIQNTIFRFLELYRTYINNKLSLIKKYLSNILIISFNEIDIICFLSFVFFKSSNQSHQMFINFLKGKKV